MHSILATNKIISLEKLIPHEQIDSTNLSSVKNSIESDQVITTPIIVDEKSMMILDGHHRYNAAKQMQLKSFPVVLVNYNSPDIIVLKKNESGEVVDKDSIIQKALNNELLDYKSTYHGIKTKNGTTK